MWDFSSDDFKFSFLHNWCLSEFHNIRDGAYVVCCNYVVICFHQSNERLMSKTKEIKFKQIPENVTNMHNVSIW